jgi:hypothetical protein
MSTQGSTNVKFIEKKQSDQGLSSPALPHDDKGNSSYLRQPEYNTSSLPFMIKECEYSGSQVIKVDLRFRSSAKSNVLGAAENLSELKQGDLPSFRQGMFEIQRAQNIRRNGPVFSCTFDKQGELIPASEQHNIHSTATIG